MRDEQALRRISEARVGTLATLNPDGSPHLVPFVFAVEDGRIVSAVDHKPKLSRRLARLSNIEADPRVSVLVHHYHDDWGRLWWCRASGTATIATEPAVALRSALVIKYPQYAETPPAGPWIVIDIERIRSWSAS